MGQLDMTQPIREPANAQTGKIIMLEPGHKFEQVTSTVKRTRKGRVTEAGIAQRVETLRKQGWLCIPPRTPMLTRLMLALRGAK